MTEKYFDKFPTVTYANNKVVDITERVVLTDNTLKNPYIFYPYDMVVNERPDQFANRYYDDPYMSWVLYLTNQTIDPYYNWYLTEEELKNHMIAKYAGTNYPDYDVIARLQEKTKFYRNNWPGQAPITESTYTALPATLKKYWTPSTDQYGRILNYVRRQDDTVIDTNNIRTFTVSNTYSNSFVVDEIVTIFFDQDHIGRGQVCYSANTKDMVYIQHTSGSTAPDVELEIEIQPSSYIYGHESGVNTHFTAVANSAINLLPEEEIYFSPLSYYDYEVERNEQYKSILVIDKNYAKPLTQLIKKALE